MTQFYSLKFSSILVACLLFIFPFSTQNSFGQGSSPGSGNGSLSGETKVWHKITLTFDGPQTSETAVINPFMDYRLNVTFTHPDTTYIVPGFYAADGNAAETSASSGNKWQVHFAPDRPGTWNYSVSFRTGNYIAVSTIQSAGTPVYFDGASGSFYVSPTDKSAPDLRAKGRLAYVGKRYRQHLGTGEYFVTGGADSPENFLSYDDFDNTPNIDSLRKSWGPHIQDWQSGDPTWQNGKGKGIIGAINYLSSKGVNAFSFLTLGHLGDDKNVYPWVDPTDPVVYDVSKMAQWEILFEHADHKGMFMHIKTAERENVDYLDNGDLENERKLYYRELIARYGHHLALNWNTAEENNMGAALQKEYAQYFKDHDPYQHLVVMHTASTQTDQYFLPLLGSASEYTGASLNAFWNQVHKETERWVRLAEESGKPWIVTNDEQPPPNRGMLPDPGYMGHSGSTTPTLDQTRHSVIWGHLMAGGSGALYYFGYNYPESDLTLQDFRSRDMLFGETSVALRFFRQYVPFETMANHDSLVGNPTHDIADYCFAKPGEIYVVYVDGGGSVDLQLTQDTTEYTVQWFHPKKGGALKNGTKTRISSPGTVNIGLPPDSTSNEDWVALIKKAEPFETTNIHGWCVTDSLIAQKMDSFFTALGLNDPYYTPPFIDEDCNEEVIDTCSFTLNAGPDQMLTCNDSSFSIVANTNASQPTFVWSALSGNISYGGQGDSIVVNQVGEYMVTVVDSNGCSKTDTVIITADTSIIVDAGPDQTLDCLTGSTTIQVVTGDGSYSWSGPNGFASTDTMPTVSDSGEYVLTITSAFGCTGTDTVYVSGNDSIPVANAGPDKFLDCNTPSVTLNGSQSSSGTVSWTGPNGFAASNYNPTVTEEGTYTITITNSQGCSSSDDVNVIGDFSVQFTTAGPDRELDCNNPTVILDGTFSDPGTYSWVGPNGFTANIVNPTVSEPGVYTITNTGANGCFTTDDVIVTANFNDPIVDAGLDQTVDCNNPTAILDGSNSDPGTYSWTGPNGFNSAIASPAVSDAGMYILNITGANGCSGSDTAIVVVDTIAPIANAGPDMAIDCSNPSVTLDGSGSGVGTPLWNGPGGFTSSVLNPTVSVAGTYTLKITGANGCFSSDTVLVSATNGLPTAEAGTAGTLSCLVSSITLDGSASDPGTYSWTGPNNFTSSIVNPVVTEPGMYYLTVNAGIGCEALDSVFVPSDFTLPIAEAGDPLTIDCNNPTGTLDASSSDPGTYSWTGPNGFTATGTNPLVSEPGTYYLIVTGNNGCIAEDSVIVNTDLTDPSVDAGSDKTLDCNNPTITLDGSTSPSAIFAWTGPGGYTSSNLTPAVSIPGTYYLTATGTNGCESIDSVIVSPAPGAPLADAGPDMTLDCNNLSVVLDGSNSDPGTMSWTGPNGFTSSAISPTVTVAGMYYISVTTAGGCESTDSVEVTLDLTLPVANAGPDQVIDCNNATVIADDSDSGPGTYTWTGPGGFNSNVQSPVLSVTGTYVLTVTGTNGCSLTDTMEVTNDFDPPVADAGPDGTITCATSSLVLNGTNSDPGTYSWAGPNGFTDATLTPTVTEDGEYILTVTGTNGCTNTDTVIVNIDTLAPNIDAGLDQTLDCINGNATLDGSNSDLGIYEWSGPNGFASNQISPVVNASGMYILTLTGANGCQAKDTVMVNPNNDVPTADAGSDQTIDCNNPTVTLDGSNSDPGTYSWSGPNGFSASIANPTTNEAGQYVLTVTSGSGCIATDTVMVNGDSTPPTADAGSDVFLDCNTPAANIDASLSSAGTISWIGPNGFNSTIAAPFVTEPGTYTLTITATNGCQDTDIVEVFGDFAEPMADAGADQVIDCNNPSVTLDGNASDPGIYSWNGPNGFSSTLVNPQAFEAGSYDLTVIASNGCIASDTVIITQDTTPPTANGGIDVSIDCNTGDVVLDGSASDPGTYSWTGPNGFTSSLISPVVTEAGGYELMVTSVNGCFATDSVIVTDTCSVPCNGNAIEKFYLVNATADTIIDDPFIDGSVIDVAVTGSFLTLGVDVIECGVTVNSVRFELVGPVSKIKIENKALWALFGNTGNNYNGRNVLPGSYTLTATPYSAKSAAGTAGTAKTINFTVINSAAAAKTAPLSPVKSTKNSGNFSTAGASNSHVANNFTLKQMKVFPNPFSKKKLTIELKGDFGKTLDIRIYSATGQLLYKEERPYDDKIKLNLSSINMSNGVYQVRVNNMTKTVQYVNK